ncbi:MAG: aromatic amino acid lyase [Deltaproteobacteria bacterium]|nr:aromatic amino acid lyase [Deltaproteobacteria bacterium]
MDSETFWLGQGPLQLPDVLALARGERRLALWEDEAYRQRLRAGQEAIRARLAEGSPVYGVTTGVGASVANTIPLALQEEMPHQLLRFHGCGTGRILEEEEAAAVLVVRAASLARGHSGVSEALLERLCLALEHRLLPRIPAEGSVGASGDLTPLSYLAAMLIGEREVTFGGRVLAADAAWAELGVETLRLGPKESLALMNGTSMMAALGCLVWEQAQRLARLAAAVTAVVSEVCHGNPDHFDARIFSWKPHPGTEQAASWIREDLERNDVLPLGRLQDRYSIRCAPHVLGVLLDAAAFAKDLLEIEVNGVNDNPLVDPERGDVLHGGNFYGGHVALAMDTLKTAIASVADLLDRQLTLLCCPDTSGGLPENLVARTGDGALVHHGFKAMQISASALTAEALKLTMPAAAFSRSTESHNQDKVSMGTIAARDGLRIAELTETVGAIAVLAVCQAVDLRERDGQAPGRRAGLLRDAVRKVVPSLEHDRRQDHDIARVLELQRTGTVGLEP